ncbi:hypothetical protein BEN47_18265 [Hymenobacter lapidarius]|uniref:Uncharacterized protein n=1 Tax=Hymenobacter lapidarius TaxID=1908237 RepID=A0A1G1SVR2_9BACT|nr:hypothetical protein BEN47_18265 [Hymenobacter lapidarius]
MTLDEFRALSERDQTAAVYAAGTFVARRWQEVDEAGLLYRMPGGFFAKLTYNMGVVKQIGQNLRLGGFESAPSPGSPFLALNVLYSPFSERTPTRR